jgi:DNA-directed RNA polymerase specialized sigma24 family protein
LPEWEPGEPPASGACPVRSIVVARMAFTGPEADPRRSRAGRFDTTHWSVVLAARDRDAPRAERALSILCAAYWYPLYAFIRRQEHDPDRSADLTQEFFARLLEKDSLKAVDRAKGRFRSFLLAACTHFLANERDRTRALKRGGDRPVVSIDVRDAEGRYRAEPAHELTAERIFQRRWALTMLEGVLDRLAVESRLAGKGPMYERLKFTLTGAEGHVPYARVGAELGLSEAAVKKAAERLRRRYRELLRERIAETVADPAEVDDEIRDLFAILSPGDRR